MTEKEIDKAKKALSTSRNGELKKLFYKNGRPTYGRLYTNRQILEKLKIITDDTKINSLEEEGLQRLLGVGLARLRKIAKEDVAPWVDIEIMSVGRKVARHGFSKDIDEIVTNADKFDRIADSRTNIAKLTRDNVAKQRRLLKAV